MKTRSVLSYLVCVVALGATTLSAVAGDEPLPFPKAGADPSGQLPQLISRVDPLYPAKLRAEGIEGEVQVVFVVNKEGETTQVRVSMSSHPDFEAPAVDAVKQWKFTPGLKGGRAVNTQLVVPIKFALPPRVAK